jgi:predicted O-linked N-acetylglucosamine transferase (SPINDLY family)
LILHTSAGAHRQKLLELLGTDPQRITFVARLGMDEYLGTYKQIDVALDPHPYGGGTTTCDALWMGVPVITLPGATSIHRSGVSLRSNVGLSELMAESPEQYVHIASDLAADLPRLGKLRSSLRQRMFESPLMDAAGFVQGLHAAYRQMWRQWVGQRP